LRPLPEAAELTAASARVLPIIAPGAAAAVPPFNTRLYAAAV